ncbi:MAG: ABC transporter ATP-binding protein [Chlamydiae bacterium]|nr:ABC transporter ATP-binding protein [Chlamydiota bacterium]
MEKEKCYSRSLLPFIWKFVGLQRWIFFSILLLAFVWSIDMTAWPYVLRLVIDTLTQYDLNRESCWPVLKVILLLGLSLFIFVEVLYRLKDYLQSKAIPKLEANIRMAMFDHIQHHSPRYFNENFAGSLSNKISDMTTQVTQILISLLLFLPALAACIISVILFAKINSLFAMILGAWVVLHFSICLAFTPKCVKYSDLHAQARTTLVGKIVDSLSNNFAVNLFYRFQFEKSRISTYQKEERQKNQLSQRYTVYMIMVLGVVFLIAQVSINGFMISSWLKGSISTGEIIQIFNTVWNVSFVMWVCSQEIPLFFQYMGIATQALTVMQDPQDVLDVPHAKPLVVKKGEIIFENVSFFYGKKKMFDNKSLHIKGGEKVGLVGYSGAGKSTFVNLILRFYPIEKGQILIDGQDIATVTLKSLHRQVALIPQDPLLFHRSLEDNIRYGNVEATTEEVIKAAKQAHCHEFIIKTPEGYNTLVGERGSKLSGGERQRIAIARAMLAAAPILILDEATSALDSVTEQYIQESLDKLMQNRTTLVVAHRLSTLSKMDRILVFDQGKVIEQGSHSELISKGGNYSRMWKMQAGGFLPDNAQSKS